MAATPLFTIGRCEISPAAAEATRILGIDPQTLFARHERGDWGDAPEWLRNDNRNALKYERSFHAIRSDYRLNPKCEFTVVTARERTRTRLMLAAEFTNHEVSVQAGYAAWAETYHYPNPLIAVEEPVAEALLATLPSLESAVDVGTGTGRWAHKLVRHGVAEVLGLDATPEMLAVARRTAQEEGMHNLRFELFSVGDAPLPAASESCDLLTCGLMLCHVADMRGAFAEFARVVRPGGWLLITDFHPSTAGFGWRTDFVTPEGVYLLPNSWHTREEYLQGLTEVNCSLLAVEDIALDGQPYGDISEDAMQARGWPPLCLVILAQKQPPL